MLTIKLCDDWQTKAEEKVGYFDDQGKSKKGRILSVSQVKGIMKLIKNAKSYYNRDNYTVYTIEV